MGQNNKVMLLMLFFKMVLINLEYYIIKVKSYSDKKCYLVFVKVILKLTATSIWNLFKLSYFKAYEIVTHSIFVFAKLPKKPWQQYQNTHECVKENKDAHRHLISWLFKLGLL